VICSFIPYLFVEIFLRCSLLERAMEERVGLTWGEWQQEVDLTELGHEGLKTKICLS